MFAIDPDRGCTLSNAFSCRRALGRNLQNLNTANHSTGFFLIDPSDQYLNQLVCGYKADLAARQSDDCDGPAPPAELRSFSLRSARGSAGGLGNGGRQGQLPLLRGLERSAPDFCQYCFCPLTDPHKLYSSIFGLLGKNHPTTSNCVDRKWLASGTDE